jgi:hypothetical protein
MALIALLLGVGCAAAGHIEHTWTEDVQLDDGAVIVIERQVELMTTGALGGGAGNAVETRSVLAIRDKPVPAWEVPLMPLVLYQDAAAKEWVIVATSHSCETWHRRGSPPGMYWEFRSNGSWWRPVPLSESSIGRKSNLLFLYAVKDLPQHITVAEKLKRQSDPTIWRPFQGIYVQQPSCMPVA